MIKVLKIIGSVFAVLVIGLLLFVVLAWDKTYDAPYPAIEASNDSTIIEHGKHLIFGAAHCATCHVPLNKIPAVDAGAIIPLSGGWELPIPPGTFRGSNLTPHPENGIGRLTDGEIARVLRHSVGDDGRVIFPLMPFQNMSDEDLTAIISYLRTQEPVDHPVERTEYSFLGKALLAFGALKPDSPIDTPPATVLKDSTIAYGSYLANSVANCAGCHTKRDLKTGAFIGERFAGGFVMPPDAHSGGYSFITPNLTPEKETGVLASWTEDAFVRRFQAGRLIEHSPMPWGSFAQMDEIELKALYRYLSSIAPVSNSIPQTVFEPGEEISDD